MRFDADSPESGWEPFMEWMRSAGLDPMAAKSLDVDESAMTATVHEYVMPKRAIGNELAMEEPRTIAIRSLPPRRSPVTGLRRFVAAWLRRLANRIHPYQPRVRLVARSLDEYLR